MSIRMLPHCLLSFQPTLPARGATFRPRKCLNPRAISTHAPRTGSDVKRLHRSCAGRISTHAPRTGSDSSMSSAISSGIGTFQPTLPARGATFRRIKSMLGVSISTHAPRTGSDSFPRKDNTSRSTNFNPRSPHGERRLSASSRSGGWHFNPRSPHGERLRSSRTFLRAV